MKRNWEKCQTSSGRTRWASFYVVLSTKGQITLNKFTHERLGGAEHVQLLYERDTNTIGIDPVGRKTPDSFYLALKPSGGRIIHALRLMRDFGIKIPHGLRFMNPEIDEDGVLILDLNDTRPATKRRPSSPNEPYS